MRPGSHREPRLDRWAGWVGPGRPRLFPAVADVLPPGSMQTPFRLRAGEGARAHSRGVRLGSPLTPDCPRQWSRSCPEPFSCSPRFRGMSPLGPVLEQGTPGGPLRKRPGLRLRVGPAASAGSPASGSHQARGGGSCRGGPGRGTCLLQATHKPNPRERGLGPTTAASAPWPAAPPPGAHAPPSSEATPPSSSHALFPQAAFSPHWPLLLQGSAALPTACWEPRFSGAGLANIPLTPETQRDQERRIRREIANSNERRRMQSINAGFQSLKTLIPHTDGEKLSKAAILQQTAEYIFSLEQEKTRLLQQNTQLKRFIQELSGSSPKRRRAEDKDEGIGSPDIWEDEKAEDLRREMIELRQQLDKERSVRMMLEEQVRSLEAHMYPEKLKVIAQQVQLQQQQEQVRLLHQEKLEREQQHLRTQLLPPPAPTHHPTVIVPAPPPPPSHHINVVTMGPSSVINSVSTSRQNLDTIVQAIQHIEGTQEKQELEEEQRRAVIVKPVRSGPEAPTSDTASDSEASDSDAMDQSREEPSGDGELP
ncbi:transcription factor AP-4 isoform X1 [Pan troglodytes]|uniref:transcription factor AP-4 isoform X1 n=2 Tax=Pan troglodytes TaxID=9598 RepID=UPI0007DBDD24|nr:transcription factor AP-4 isoform X1 [Pan troglodytes]